MQTELFNIYYLLLVVLTLVTTIIGITLVVYQIKQSRRTREVEISLTLSQLSMTSEMQEALDFVWDFDFSKKLTIEQFKKSEKVCVFFELIGTFIIENYMSTNIIANFYGSLLTGCYDKLYPFIKTQREKPYNEKYAINFEKSAQILTIDKRVSVQNPREKNIKK